MSRSDLFANHPFQSIWRELLSRVKTLRVDDVTVATSVDDLDRLKRMIPYLDGMLQTIEPDMTPKSLWDLFAGQVQPLRDQISAYESSRNAAHLAQANDHVDNLLSYVRPYSVLPADVVTSMRRAADAYQDATRRYLTDFHRESASATAELRDTRSAAQHFLEQAQAGTAKIQDLIIRVFDGDPNSSLVERSLTATKFQVDTLAQDITNAHVSLINGESSTKAQMLAMEQELIDQKVRMTKLVEAASQVRDELNEFHAKIFGTVKDDGVKKEGLREELESHQKRLAEYEDTQQKRHQALFFKIEKLLPGASSAGLATAYGALRKNFSKPIRFYTGLFYGTLGLLVLVALILSVQKLTLAPTISITLVEIKDWDYALRALVNKIPFVAPLVWLALFSSNRRSQYERLQQEYAHKEAIARSYSSYKKQLQDLDSDSDSLQRELISKAIDAIAFNASTTLDHKLPEKSPSHLAVDKVNLDLEKIKEFFSLSKTSN
jgi:hypothetical protein